MSARTIRIAGLVGTIVYAAFIVWLYAAQPRTVAEVAGGMAASIGAYRVDQASFDEGLRFFRGDRFAEARSAFTRADPASRDAVTQFYVAYSYYRQGWGRFYNDDGLFREGREVLARARALAPGGRLVVEDDTLGLKSADELDAAFDEGLRVDSSDLNPLGVLRSRK